MTALPLSLSLSITVTCMLAASHISASFSIGSTNYRTRAYGGAALYDRDSNICLNAMKSSENGISMTRKKMKKLKSRGRLDPYEESDNDAEDTQMVLSDENISEKKKKKKKRASGREKKGRKEDSSEVESFASTDGLPATLREESSNENYMKLLNSRPALVLNADYQPLSYIPLSVWCWQDSIKAVFGGRVTVVDTYPDVTVRGIHMEMPLPSVIALNEYIPQASKKTPPFTRRNVYLRDGYRCQYCNNVFKSHELSLDHVVPRCRGGMLRWDNAVSACRKCNGRKSNLMPADLKAVGMKLVREPRAPSMYELSQKAGQLLMPRKVHPTWMPYLAQDSGWNRIRSKKSNRNSGEESLPL